METADIIIPALFTSWFLGFGTGLAHLAVKKFLR